MIIVLIVVLSILLFMLLVQQLWQHKLVRGEYSRKLIHITITTFVATWPFYLSWGMIQFLAFGAIGFTLLARLFHWFPSMYDIKRRSYGDLIGQLTVGILALLQPSPWIFAAAALHVALADGLAAVIGTRYGKTHSYTVFGQKKSLAGTLTFIVVSVAITAWVLWASPLPFEGKDWLVIIWLPLITAIGENVSRYGFDNLTIGLLVAGALSLLV